MLMWFQRSQHVGMVVPSKHKVFQHALFGRLRHSRQRGLSTAGVPPPPKSSSGVGRGNRFLNLLRDFQQSHNRLKNYVHTAWRYPLPPWGRATMGGVYFSIPVLVGYYVSTYAIAQSDATLVERFGSTSNKRSSDNDNNNANNTTTSKVIGAGGWGGGVRLAGSDSSTQETNRINLERFLKQQRRRQRNAQHRSQERVE